MHLFGISLRKWLPWRILSRIRMLLFVLDRIGRGDFGQKAPISEDDIIGKLGIKINEIADSLSSQMDALRHERAQIETIVDNMSEGVVVTDVHGVILFANIAWYNIFETTPKSLGHPLLESVRIPHIFDSIKNAFLKNIITEVEFGVGDRCFVARSAPLKTQDFNGCVTVVNDISKTKHLENIRRDFTANVSHQMKTPLTSIIGYSETLLDGALNDNNSAVNFVKTIHSESKRLKELIDDVLDLAKIESPSLKKELKEFDVSVLITDLLGEFGNNKKGITIKFSGQRINISSNPQAVRHIVHNLLDNAIKYSYDGGIIDVDTAGSEKDVIVLVRDYGIGISEEDLPRIFERFYRVNNLQTKEGSGLGLAIAKHLAEQITANILVESELGKGSIFKLIIPK